MGNSLRINRIAGDVGLGVLFIAALAVTALAFADSWGGNYWLFDCAAGVVVCLIALARRRDRAWTAVAGLSVAAVAILIAWIADLPHEPAPAMALALSVLVGSAVSTLPVPWAAAIAAAGFAVVAVAWLTGGFTAVAVLNSAGWIAAVVIGLSLRLLETHRQSTADKVRRDERLELARELHDVVAHHVTGIVVQAQAAQLVTRKHPENLDGPLAGIGASLAGIEAAGSDALAAMRRVVGLLRDTADAPPTTSAAETLSDLVKRFDGHRTAVHLRLPDSESTWPPELTSTVYRVVQESLTNIARHATEARSVTVSVDQREQSITVEVTDDAPPAPARYQHRGGYGLIGMRERLETLGGTLSAGPRAGAGWSVLATLPVPARGSR